jgi:GDPmannose 4,6-dehydratase
MKTAVVFGAGGQLGSYMADLLFTKPDYKVYPYWRYHTPDYHLACDVTSPEQVYSILNQRKPDEIYNFASLMYAPDSWKEPQAYVQTNGFAVVPMLDWIVNKKPECRFFNAGSAEVFDKRTTHQDEDCRMVPENPYAAAKVFAYHMVKMYREQKGLHASTGIFFNAESPRRKDTFFAQKVCKAVVRLQKLANSPIIWEKIKLGRLDAMRDWGWASEYVDAAYRMVQADKADDYVIGTGESHSCLSFVCEALTAAGLGKESFKDYFEFEEAPILKSRSLGPTDFWALLKRQSVMCANPEKIKRVLGWEAQYKMKDVIARLVAAYQENP